MEGGWQHRKRPHFANAVRASGAAGQATISLTPTETLVVTAIAYLQPVGRGKLSQVLDREVGRDVVARLKRLDLVATGPTAANNRGSAHLRRHDGTVLVGVRPRVTP